VYNIHILGFQVSEHKALDLITVCVVKSRFQPANVDYIYDNGTVFSFVFDIWFWAIICGHRDVYSKQSLWSEYPVPPEPSDDCVRHRTPHRRLGCQ